MKTILLSVSMMTLMGLSDVNAGNDNCCKKAKAECCSKEMKEACKEDEKCKEECKKANLDCHKAENTEKASAYAPFVAAKTSCCKK